MPCAMQSLPAVRVEYPVTYCSSAIYGCGCAINAPGRVPYRCPEHGELAIDYTVYDRSSSNKP